MWSTLKETEPEKLMVNLMEGQQTLQGFKNAYSFVAQYTHFADKYCNGEYISSYTTLQDAKEACSNNIECGCIYDVGCSNHTWTISKGSSLASSGQGSCAWAFVSSKRKCC